MWFMLFMLRHLLAWYNEFLEDNVETWTVCLANYLLFV